MVWYYESWKKVGRLKITGDLAIIEIDGGGVYDIPVSDVVDIISNAVQVPLNPENLSEGLASLSKSHLGLKFTIPVGGKLYVAIVRQVVNMIENPEKKAGVWVPVG